MANQPCGNCGRRIPVGVILCDKCKRHTRKCADCKRYFLCSGELRKYATKCSECFDGRPFVRYRPTRKHLHYVISRPGNMSIVCALTR